MLKHLSINLPTTLTATLLLAPLALAPGVFAKPKDPGLPAYVLQARTVLVVIDPMAGVDLDDPRANEVAREDVQSALLSWGRFEMVQSGQAADLTIVIRRGTGKLVDTTVTDPRQTSRPGDVAASDDAIMLGGQRGRPPNGSPNPMPGVPTSTHPQTEVGNVVDSFVVYQHSSDGNIAWRYMAKDGLRSHNVPAVEEFKKAIAEAEKAAAKQGKTPPATPSAQPQANPPAPSSHP